MNETKQWEAPTEQLVISEQMRNALGGGRITDEDAFRDGQHRDEEMIGARAPLSEILDTLVRMVEAQSPGMLCSVLLLSPDGNHIQHGAAPSLPQEYVTAIDGEPIGPKKWFVRNRDVPRRTRRCQ
jgi:hypothetical protein